MHKPALQRLLLILAISLFAFASPAQYYSAGQDPASTQWKQINTDNFQIIFPEAYAEQALYIADILEYSYYWASISLKHEPRKVSVIVHNQTVISNGFVSWAPRRMELYTNPPANSDTHPWMEGLALHEYRHVVQIDKLHQGIPTLFKIIFGEQATGVMLGLFVPLWFLEGDAVVTETAMTHSGRGRLPVFEQGLRAQVLSRGTYSFDKAVFGSYKDHVPNHYELGYQLVAAARADNGADAWSGVIDKVAKPGSAILPFNRGMRNETGRGKVAHYRHTFEKLDSIWTKQHQAHTYSPSQSLSPQNRLYTNYSHASWINDSTVIALKTGLRDIPQVVKINLYGSEEKLFAPGWFFPNAFHYAAGKLVWNEQQPDPRWEHRNWSEIMLYDLESKTTERITRKGRFFSPALSPDGKRIATIETSDQSSYAMVILDAQTAEEMYRFAYPQNDFIMQPAWHPDGEQIAVVTQNSLGKRIDIINIEEDKSSNLLPPSHNEISSPRFHEEYILFNGTWTGIDNIYRVHTYSGKVEQIVSSEFGAINANISPGGGQMVFSDYTDRGYTLKTLGINQILSLPLEALEDHSAAFHKILADQEKAVISEENIPRRQHEITDYSRLRNLFHLHSWAPAYIDAQTQEAKLGASLMFQNKLSTSFATLGYHWDQESETGRYSAVYSYKGWYPVLDLIAETGNARAYYTYDETELRNFLFTDNAFRLALSVPLRYQHREYFYGLTPWMRMGVNQSLPNRHTPERIFVNNNQYFELADNTLYFHEYRLLAYRQRRQVARDIYPRFGQIFDLTYRHNPLGTYTMGSVFSVRGIMYLPGLLPHQGLRLSAGHQQRTLSNSRPNTIRYGFGNNIPYPRGYTQQNHQQLNAFSAEYVFPMLYPDLSIPMVIYLMRLRGSIFADHALAKRFANPNNPGMELNETLTSYGFSLVGDMHLLRFLAPISLGMEVSFPQNQDLVFTLVMNVRF